MESDLKTIVDFLTKLKGWNQNFNFNHTSYEFDISEAEVLRVPEIQVAYKWLRNIIETRYREIMRLWRMQGEKQWYGDFMIFDNTDHRHVKLLIKAVNAMITDLRKHTRPDFFKKTKRDAWYKIYGEAAKN
jgi:hypothetical protein